MKMWFECSLCSVIGMSIFTFSLVNSNTTLGVSTYWHVLNLNFYNIVQAA